MSRILYVATSDIHLRTFHIPYLEWLASEGHVVDIVAERRGELTFGCVNHAYWLPFPRTLASFKHLRTLRRLKEIIEGGNYDIVHCHTPIPSALTRLAARKWRETGGKLLYTAHGFHFFRGGPLVYWLTYYPVEWLLSGITDAIIAINREDYGYINQKMRHKHSYLIPGIGVQTSRFIQLADEQKREVRHQMGYGDADFLLLYIAEFIPRKNHHFLIDAIEKAIVTLPNLRCLLAGRGITQDSIREEVERRKLSAHVEFLGFQSNVEKYAAIADVGVSTSKQEGLGLGLLEQMLCGVPVVASEDRGHREYVENGVTGFLYPQGDQAAFVDGLTQLYRDRDLRSKMGELGAERAKKFSIEHALPAMKDIYYNYLLDRDGS